MSYCEGGEARKNAAEETLLAYKEVRPDCLLIVHRCTNTHSLLPLSGLASHALSSSA